MNDSRRKIHVIWSSGNSFETNFNFLVKPMTKRIWGIPRSETALKRVWGGSSRERQLLLVQISCSVVFDITFQQYCYACSPECLATWLATYRDLAHARATWACHFNTIQLMGYGKPALSAPTIGEWQATTAEIWNPEFVPLSPSSFLSLGSVILVQLLLMQPKSDGEKWRYTAPVVPQVDQAANRTRVHFMEHQAECLWGHPC